MPLAGPPHPHCFLLPGAAPGAPDCRRVRAVRKEMFCLCPAVSRHRLPEEGLISTQEEEEYELFSLFHWDLH